MPESFTNANTDVLAVHKCTITFSCMQYILFLRFCARLTFIQYSDIFQEWECSTAMLRTRSRRSLSATITTTFTSTAPRGARMTTAKRSTVPVRWPERLSTKAFILWVQFHFAVDRELRSIARASRGSYIQNFVIIGGIFCYCRKWAAYSGLLKTVVDNCFFLYKIH